MPTASEIWTARHEQGIDRLYAQLKNEVGPVGDSRQLDIRLQEMGWPTVVRDRGTPSLAVRVALARHLRVEVTLEALGRTVRGQ